jgi:nucleoside-diphosphate-sugar epimerase
MVLQKLAKKEKALWLGNPSARHAFTYVPDAGKAMYLLGQTPSSGGQVWHMPTAPALTGRQFLEMTAAAVNAPLKYMVVNKLMLQAMGLFNPLIREAVEMYYQYRHDYIFDSSKFENAFGFTPTSYHDGLRQEATYYHTQASRPAHSLA